MEYLKLLCPIITGYFVGSINFSVIVTKYIGKFDIYSKGSGNAGGTNVARTMGTGWGVAVIAIEILKCVAVGLFAKYIFPVDPLGLGELGPVITGTIAVFFCLIGNVFPLYSNFRGGKGVATCAGLVVLIDVRIFLVLLLIFLIVLACTRLVSLSSIIAAISLVISIPIAYHNKENWWILFVLITIMIGILLVRHRDNIVRLCNGTERKFKIKKCKKK